MMGTYIFLWSIHVTKSMPKKIYRQLLSVFALLSNIIIKYYKNQLTCSKLDKLANSKMQKNESRFSGIQCHKLQKNIHKLHWQWAEDILKKNSIL